MCVAADVLLLLAGACLRAVLLSQAGAWLSQQTWLLLPRRVLHADCEVLSQQAWCGQAGVLLQQACCREQRRVVTDDVCCQTVVFSRRAVGNGSVLQQTVVVCSNVLSLQMVLVQTRVCPSNVLFFAQQSCAAGRAVQQACCEADVLLRRCLVGCCRQVLFGKQTVFAAEVVTQQTVFLLQQGVCCRGQGFVLLLQTGLLQQTCVLQQTVLLRRRVVAADVCVAAGVWYERGVYVLSSVLSQQTVCSVRADGVVEQTVLVAERGVRLRAACCYADVVLVAAGGWLEQRIVLQQAVLPQACCPPANVWSQQTCCRSRACCFCSVLLAQGVFCCVADVLFAADVCCSNVLLQADVLLLQTCVAAGVLLEQACLLQQLCCFLQTVVAATRVVEQAWLLLQTRLLQKMFVAKRVVRQQTC
uniref:Secreted protein n=1 Tax=Knipowitschia caucasica TaxID=637954 RepID=A0AAV2M2J6_KNICA